MVLLVDSVIIVGKIVGTALGALVSLVGDGVISVGDEEGVAVVGLLVESVGDGVVSVGDEEGVMVVDTDTGFSGVGAYVGKLHILLAIAGMSSES